MEVKRGQTYVAVRSRSARRWRVAKYLHSQIWLLVPLGDDVVPAQVNGRMQGGVRNITRGTEELLDPKRWRLVE